jgi:Fe2+ transport system protein FeoA
VKPDLPTGDCERGTDNVCCVVCPLSSSEPRRLRPRGQLSGAPRLQRRLMALGLHPSAELAVLGRGPGGGCMELRAGTVHLMLRACEAHDVLVEVDDPRLERVPRGGGRHALPTV